MSESENTVHLQHPNQQWAEKVKVVGELKITATALQGVADLANPQLDVEEEQRANISVLLGVLAEKLNEALERL